MASAIKSPKKGMGDLQTCQKLAFQNQPFFDKLKGKLRRKGRWVANPTKKRLQKLQLLLTLCCMSLIPTSNYPR